MLDNSDSNIATADALTLLLHNQHALAAAIEEVTVWLSANGLESVADNAVAAMETLDANATLVTEAIMRLRQFYGVTLAGSNRQIADLRLTKVVMLLTSALPDQLLTVSRCISHALLTRNQYAARTGHTVRGDRNHCLACI